MRKEFFIVCTSLFLLTFGTYLSNTVLVPYTKSLGGTSMSVGIVYGSMFIARLLLGTPIGRISQKKGAKAILRYSLILYPFIAVAYWISWDIPSLVAARLLQGVASAMMLPMVMAYIGEVSPIGQEGRFMGIYNTVLYGASAIGPFIGGIIFESYGVRFSFFSLLIFALFSLFIFLIFTKSNAGNISNKAAEPDASSKEIEKQFKKAWKNKKLLGLSSVNIVNSVLIALLGASFTQLALSYKMSMGLIGLLIALNNLVIGITQVPLGHFVDRHNKQKLLFSSGIIISVLVIIFPLVKSMPGLVVLIAVLAIFTSLNLATSTALSAILGKEAGMGNTMGFLGSANSAGTMVGFFVLGGIADLFGLYSTFYFTGIVFFIGSVLNFYLFNGSFSRKH